MSAFGTSTPYYAPPRGLVKPWALPTPAFATGRGAGDAYGLTPAPQPQSVGSPPTSKGQLLRGCFASLDRFPAPSASDRFATPKEMERGQGATQSCISPLTPWNRPNTQPRGMWIGFATCPCGLASESGVWGKAPRSCFLVFGLVS